MNQEEAAAGRVSGGAVFPRKRITFVGHLSMAVWVCSLGWYFL
ncbi:MAG: hypothetical protein ACYSSL_02590 [Planctomycetota bacterium]